MSEPERDEPANREPPGDEVDMEKLADLVYRLMRDEARLDAARGGPIPPRRRC